MCSNFLKGWKIQPNWHFGSCRRGKRGWCRLRYRNDASFPHTLCIRFSRILALHCYRCYNRNEIHTHCKMHHCLALFASAARASLLPVHPCYKFYISCFQFLNVLLHVCRKWMFLWKLLKKFRLMIVFYKCTVKLHDVHVLSVQLKHICLSLSDNFFMLQCDMLQACAICNLICDTLHLKLQHEQSVKWWPMTCCALHPAAPIGLPLPRLASLFSFRKHPRKTLVQHWEIQTEKYSYIACL